MSDQLILYLVYLAIASNSQYDASGSAGGSTLSLSRTLSFVYEDRCPILLDQQPVNIAASINLHLGRARRSASIVSCSIYGKVRRVEFGNPIRDNDGTMICLGRQGAKRRMDQVKVGNPNEDDWIIRIPDTAKSEVADEKDIFRNSL